MIEFKAWIMVEGIGPLTMFSTTTKGGCKAWEAWLYTEHLIGGCITLFTI